MTQHRLLITGLNGVIGWHLFQQAEKKFNVFGTYRKEHPALKKKCFYRTNLDQKSEVLELIEKVRPEYLIHSRGICDLDVCEENPEMAQKINVEGTRLLVEAVGQTPGLKKFVYISTDHVFFGDRGNYSDQDIPKPKHVYGRTKRDAEKVVAAAIFPHLIIRPGLAMGKSFQGNKGPRDFLFSRIRAKKPTHLFTDEWRSPIAAEALAEQILEVMLSETTGVFHIAGEKAYNRFELGIKDAREHGLPIEYVHPRLRREDKWAKIRPKDISLKSSKGGTR